MSQHDVAASSSTTTATTTNAPKSSQNDDLIFAKDPDTKIIWLDGCFDMMHFGHANAIRQAYNLFPKVKLLVGVHSDEEILRHKGPTVMKAQERYEHVRSCKWVDGVVEDAPYVTDLEMLKKYNVDYCVHGDDISFDENGEDSYKSIRQAGLMMIVPRTEGVSTTDIVGRMLKLSKYRELVEQGIDPSTMGDELKPQSEIDQTAVSPYTRTRQHYPSVHQIRQFSEKMNPPKPGAKIVYVDGAFDMFHTGHIEFLKAARKFGDYLIVGLHEDKVIAQFKGPHHPIMNIHERLLSVLSCRYVDDVIIGAPFIVTQDLIDVMKISVVISGTVKEPEVKVDPYELPKKLGIYQQIESPCPELTTTNIINRIIDNAKRYEERNRKKQAKEIQGIASLNTNN
ncbi:hypothetical protein FDP41_002313 [Naegleria fowleri]|uniref:ethanolamine-phosphate cytidylyltransferase n=1 Tax=Naegleria fowleri TaxID=5763 RepID=A0A6A5BKG7_NAEFO|nr:uncharacterized protein FDP41_002313 [Naegleria fowleri]KAF0978493.1 hypothetical protein FDP41_002313 [Naegleria fowleri]CAG4718490.1 unnamed protein product [Naegleria fowleri]